MEKKKKRVSKKDKTVSRRDFLKLTGAVTAGVAAGSLIDISSPKPAGAQAPTGTINVVHSTDVDTYDPHAWMTSDATYIGYHIFEQLVTLDYEPMLATSWENPDKLSWVFHLKENVAFTNGQPFDASVVKFNIERILDPKTKAIYGGLFEPVESVSVMDKHTVKIKTKKPYSVLIPILSQAPMVSPKAVEELGKDFGRKPVGTGPFVFKEWVPLERTVIEANPAYYGPKPKVKTIVWKPIGEPSTRIVELRTGKAHLINKVPPELAQDISGEGIKPMRRKSLWRLGFKLNCAKPPFDKVKVRQALNYAVDREALIKSILYGAGYIPSGFLGSDREGYNPDLKPYPRDPARSKQLLAEAGYPNGVDIELLTSMGRQLKDKEISEAVSYQVKDAGFNMKVIGLEWAMFLQKFRDFNGFYLGDDNPTHIAFFNTAYSRGRTSYSWMGYRSEEFNNLFEESEATFGVQQKKAVYQKMDKMLWDECPWLNLYFTEDIYGVSDHLKDFVPRYDGYMVLTNASLV
jgi:peptide/nickel transport system substrate-binding protein